MVKKFLSVFAAASTMLATSCSNEEFGNGLNGNEADVTFTAQLPEGLQSRAYGDGTTATTLSYAVYLKNTDGSWTKTSVGNNDEEIENLRKTVSLRLVNGNTYQVVFWADAQSSVYTFDDTNRKVTANYSNITSNEEKLDAFFAVEEIIVNGASSKNVELKRPFAQLNIGTADLTEAKTAGINVTEAGIKVKAYKTLNFDGTVADSEDVTFGLAELPTNETFPVEGNKYLTMNYLLMPADKKADNTVTIFYDNAQVPERTFNNVPLQRNYRTNIYGKLLTSNEEFNVEINPDFNNPDYKVEVWDGTTVTAPTFENNEYQIKTAAEFVWLSKNQGNGLSNNVSILEDIDLGGNAIQQMRVAQQITFNGNGHTISNFVLNCAPNLSEDYANGLFATEGIAPNSSFTVKDVTIKNVKVDVNGTEYAFAGTIISDVQNEATILLSGVVVDNADVCGMQSVGGLVGYVAANSNVTVENCTVKNSYIHNHAVENESGFVAGLVGRPVGNVTVTGSTVKNTIIDGYYTQRRGENSIANVVGTKNDTDTGATVENVTVNKILVNANVTIVSTMAELQAALPVRVGGQNADGGTIVLANDIDMTGWTSIEGTYTNFVLDGAGHSLKNLSTPLYSNLGIGTYKVCNLNFENVSMNMTSTQLSGFAGALVAEIQANGGISLTIVNCNINNSQIDGYKYAGGFIGCASGGNESKIEILNSTVNNTEVSTDDSSCGGLIGHNYAHLNIKGCKVTGTTTIKCAEDRGNGKAKAGYLVGTVNGGVTTITNCTVASSVKLENTNAYTYNAKAYVGRNEGGTIND